MKIHMGLTNKAVQNVNEQSAVNSLQFTVVRLAKDDLVGWNKLQHFALLILIFYYIFQFCM